MTDLIERLRGAMRIMDGTIGGNRDDAYEVIEAGAMKLIDAHDAMVIRLGEVTTMLEAERRRIAEAPEGIVVACDLRKARPTWHVTDERDEVTASIGGKRVALVVLP